MEPSPNATDRAQLIHGLCADLVDEQTALDALVAGLSDDQWRAPTPAAGWDIRDSISHLCFFDQMALVALTDRDAFASHLEAVRQDALEAPDITLGRSLSPDQLLDRWRRARTDLLTALQRPDAPARVPWYGPPMSLSSFTTARLMETWAHGQDVIDALSVDPVVSDRLRHVCHIGIAARPYAFAVNNRDDPGEPMRVDLEAPDGAVWEWGPRNATARISGRALDFALVVTRRRHPGDTDLVVTGPVAQQWIEIAQSFAGPPGPRRRPGLRRFADRPNSVDFTSRSR